jgi:D-threo-aldose 1-dehydrogenase
MNLPKVVFGTSSLGNLYVVLPEEVKCALVEAYLKAVNGAVFLILRENMVLD